MENLENYIKAFKARSYNSYHSDNIKDYDEHSIAIGELSYKNICNNVFMGTSDFLNQVSSSESSHVTNNLLNIKYLTGSVEEFIQNANLAKISLSLLDVNQRFDLLHKSLDGIKGRFFEIAHSTVHTTGQSFNMAFQASGPHAADRALEAMVAAYIELNSFELKSSWIKDFGKFKLEIFKDYIPIAKGIALSIGCSTFPTWNSVSGIYANIMCGNPVIVKPHPNSILPIAIFVKEIRDVFNDMGLNANIIQLAPDTIEEPVTKFFTEHDDIKIIDYTGGNLFGNYIEELGKVSFTEKAGVNCCIVDSGISLESICANIAFSISLYSGQMCTAPQNIFIPEQGILIDNVFVSYDSFKDKLIEEVEKIANHPKAGPGTYGFINNSATLKRIDEMSQSGNVILASKKLTDNMRSPLLLEYDSSEYDSFKNEYFGPISFIIKTKDTLESLELAERLGKEKGALTCLAFCSEESLIAEIRNIMNNVFVPVSFNFSGAGFINQHSAFSDLHVTGGNPAGNATFTNSEYISKRFVWVGNRYMK